MDTRESEWVRQAAAGDRAAFEALARAYEKKVYSLALRMSHDREDAFDLSQDIFLKLYRTLPQFRGESAFSTWLYRLAYNVCLDFTRKRARRRELPLSPRPDGADSPPAEWPDLRYAPENEYEKKELRAAVAQAMDDLSPEHRAVLTLRDIEGLSYEEIAEALTLPTGTVKSRLARAREGLRGILVAQGNFFAKETSKEAKGGDAP
ncbi:MAG: sigma-70 family RNA polymerase sigma factor [Oscillospiraceae bacterium]|jgi:RNA polymerase sigma-70 factor (ECF subfamily)|nr:sigma-70 family RNA polymerase sigma factor [Oscillospiraceae bacterium]